MGQTDPAKFEPRWHPPSALASLFLCFILSGTFGVAQPAGPQVSGEVVDASGAVVPHCVIAAIPWNEGRHGGTIASWGWAPTDPHGRFVLSVSPGRYKIVAQNEAMGYPDPLFALNVDHTAHFPVVLVRNRGISSVHVKLGKKGAILESEVRDAKTGKGIFPAKVTIRDASHPEMYVEVYTDKNGRSKFAILPQLIVISAAAPGYKPLLWEAGKQVLLSSGEHRKVTLALTRQ